MEDSQKARAKVFKKRVILSIAQKLEIIEDVDQSGRSVDDVAQEWDIPVKNINALLKDKQKYRQYFSEGRNIYKKKQRRVLRQPLENAMKLFVHEARNNNQSSGCSINAYQSTRIFCIQKLVEMDHFLSNVSPSFVLPIWTALKSYRFW
ncbi:uncharacterized protein LOC128267548 isoform X3 [Anopheles cruzii]|uniref:uncharacterized protein LOC128267548 isoform X3 n=1 Tax=Anopheles cruzii TaxID=68878 RepID=UPI0022EC875E|nr:uncharacterized protein LOC128267548 isoform X3 [Anopheles cruzii]